MIQARAPKPIIDSNKLNDNAFSMLAATQRALLGSKLYTPNEVQSIMNEMQSGDYDKVIQTMLTYCIID